MNTCHDFEGVELRATTSTRLKTALYSFTAPGGPMYPTRPVRHAAWETLDVLFPVRTDFQFLTVSHLKADMNNVILLKEPYIYYLVATKEG